MSVNREHGVSLVEVLVALVVLSVGLLGVAALLVQSVQGTRTALYRTKAVNLVSDMADRIRANAIAGVAYHAPAPVPAPAPGAEGTCQSTPDAASTPCTAEQLAADDLGRWRLAIQDSFPRVNNAIPAGTVQFIAGTPQTFRVSVAWQEPPSTQNGAPDNYTYSADVVVMPR
jgi:type IV pilus assembly protein PilV